MKTRILTGLVMALVGIPVLIFSDTFIYPLVASLLCVGAVIEVLRAIGGHRAWLLSVPAYVLAACAPLGAYVLMGHLSTDGRTYLLWVLLALVAYLLYLGMIAVLFQGRIGAGDVTSTFSLTLYVILAFTALCILRYMPNGAYIYLLVFVGSWVCDVFAYFTGMLIGRHKLAPVLSPKKTIEGSVGGMVFTVLAFLLYGYIVTLLQGPRPNYLILAACGLTLSVVAQIGDLFASLIKRERGIKDYGRIFPGHGGIMDRFDSILAVATVLLMISLIAPPIG